MKGDRVVVVATPLTPPAARATVSTSNPGENHWHGAAPNRLMTHLAIQEADEHGPVTWGAHVTDEQYNGPLAD
jgi:quercetin dioxygenase-like cupin family protein